MPWIVMPNAPSCPSDKPFGVRKEATGEMVGCHATHGEANDHVAALYANDTQMYWETNESRNLAEFSNERREDLGKEGKAFKNHAGEWSYPVVTVEDLKNAISAFGRSAEVDRAGLKSYIMRRARSLGQADLIPENWTGKNMSAIKASYLVDIGGLELQEVNGVDSCWVHALPIGSYKHPVYGTLDVTSDRVKRFADNVKTKIRGIDPSINYNHNNDDVAAGWVKDAEARSDGLWVFVEWVKDAARKIKKKEYRYFSSEFEDVWTDTKGIDHKDVFFGGGLTNRPFMKNLVPINLSEQVFDNAFDLVSIISGQSVEELRGGKGNMELSEAQLSQIATAVAKTLGENAPKTEVTPQVNKLEELPGMKELAESNPTVRILLEQVEAQNRKLAESATVLRGARIQNELREFDKSKIVLTPVSKDLVNVILTELPDGQHENFWKLMENVRTSQAFLVELGERSGATATYGYEKSPIKRFNDMTSDLVSTGVDLATAIDRVAQENPDLYARYRSESYSFKA